MKKFMLLVVLSFASMLSGYAQDVNRIYEKYSDCDSVSAIYVSQSMFNMIKELPEIKYSDSDSLDITPIITNFRGLYLLNSSNKEVNTGLAADLKKLLSAGKYSMLMEIKDSGDKVNMYVESSGNVATSFVFTAIEQDECTFIYIDGAFRLDELNKLLAQGSKGQ